MGQSNTLLVAIKEEESFMCTRDEQTYLTYSNVKTDSPHLPTHLFTHFYTHKWEENLLKQTVNE